MAESQQPWEVPGGAKSSYDHCVECEGIPAIKTLFVEDIRKAHLEWRERKGGNGAFLQMDYNVRGADGTNIKFELSQNTTACHILEFSVGTYKRAQCYCEGCSLIWPDDPPIRKYDWYECSMAVPPENFWHQHFNAGHRPARCLDLRAFGGKKYQPSLDRKKDGSQIEYADEEQIVHDWFNLIFPAACCGHKIVGVSKGGLNIPFGRERGPYRNREMPG